MITRIGIGGLRLGGRAFVTLLLLLVLSNAAQAQTDPSNVPQPPTDALARLKPFLGTYTVTGNYAGQEWSGTIDVRPAVKGWYVEWEINVHSGPIDRQLLLLMTWDREKEQYRIWRFETQDQVSKPEGTGKFSADEFLMEWAMPAPDGEPGIFRNRVTMEDADTLVIVSEGERASSKGKAQRIGVFTARRRL